VRNRDYVPRNEPPNWTSGGKVVKSIESNGSPWLTRRPR
jgi:hypothetical protein